ncbi:hypothetical protein [Alishewanella longhuensis]
MANTFIEAATQAPLQQLAAIPNYRWGSILAEALVAVLAWLVNYPILNPHLIVLLFDANTPSVIPVRIGSQGQRPILNSWSHSVA